MILENIFTLARQDKYVKHTLQLNAKEDQV